MILDKEFPPDPRVENEAISLVKNGFEVFLFCLAYGGSQKKEEELNGINIYRASSNLVEYKLSALAYTLPFYGILMKKKIAAFVEKNRIDVLHVHDIRIAGAAYKLAKQKNIPVVLDLHDNMPEIMKFYPHLQKFPGNVLISPKKWKNKEEYFIAQADKIVTVSDEFKTELIERTKTKSSKIVVVPNTVRKEFYQKATLKERIIQRYKDEFVILYVGDTGLRRGLLTAIAAIEKIKSKIKNVKLVIVGSNTTDKVLKQKVKELGLEAEVDFQGWQDVSLFASYIASSEICISPLDRNIQHDVAYANKLFQYMSFAKPVLVSNATAQKNLVEKTNSGLVHLEKNAEDFSQKVVQLYEDQILRKKLGKNGKDFIEQKFNWELSSKGLIEMYQEMQF